MGLLILVIIVIVVYYLARSKSAVHRTNNAENSSSISAGLSFLTNIAHLQCHGVCVLSIDKTAYSSSINSSITLYDTALRCSPIIRRFKSFKEKSIDASVQGEMSTEQMSQLVEKAEVETNAQLAAELFGSYSPTGYLFSNLSEQLALAPNNKDTILAYPAIVCSPKEREQRQQILNTLSRKCASLFPSFQITAQAGEISITF